MGIESRGIMIGDDNRGRGGNRVGEASKRETKTGDAPGRGTMQQWQKGGKDAVERGTAATSGPGPARYPSRKPDLADQIGARLRTVYDDVLLQPVPDRFLDLLRQLEGATGPSLARVKKDGA
jgi:hypothetical protein